LKRATPIALLVLLLSSPLAAAKDRFQIVMHEATPGTHVSRTTVAAIFLKQAPAWSDGTPTQPVDQSTKNPIRLSFAADVLGQPMVAVQIYWQRRMSAGVTPPPVKNSDEEVLQFIATTPGAIGYVSETTTLPAGVKPIKLID
jgi:ABC-type phosphate transport system substrate-binding protein